MNGDMTQTEPPSVPMVAPRIYMGSAQRYQPGGGTVLPAHPVYGVQPADEMQNEANRIRRYGEGTIDQTEQAVQSAIRFQAQRGYQKDLEGGMSAGDAMAKWGPMLFTSPRGGTANAAAMMRMASPEYRNVGGGLVRINPGGQVETVMAPREQWSWQDKQDYSEAKRRYSRNAAELAKGGLGDPTELRRQMVSDQEEMRRLSDKNSGGVTPPTSAPRSPAPVGTPPSQVPVRAFNPPASIVTGTAPPKPKSRVERAKELRSQHPDWSKQKIIDAVIAEGP